jgi:hypothetical protein
MLDIYAGHDNFAHPNESDRVVNHPRLKDFTVVKKPIKCVRNAS